jgi:deoxyribonuclease V
MNESVSVRKPGRGGIVGDRAAIYSGAPRRRSAPRGGDEMAPRRLHRWDLSPKEAIRVQDTLSRRLVLSWDGREVASVAGVDVSVKAGRARAAIVVLRFPDLEPIDGATAEADDVFPYVPGLLTFREGPVILDAWERLRSKPDLLLFDGQGIAHPRRMGLAAHVGLWLDRPSVGVAKSRLYGAYEPPGPDRGAAAALHDERDPERIIGAVLRTRSNVKPVFVSPGHRIDVERAAEFALACCTRYRLPETTRWAHRVAGGAQLPT